jgi:hypothetical protein
MQHPDAFYRGCAVAGDQKRCSLVLEGVVLMRSLWPLWRRFLIFYHEAALSQIHPLHEDVPYIVQRLNSLERQA